MPVLKQSQGSRNSKFDSSLTHGTSSLKSEVTPPALNAPNIADEAAGRRPVDSRGPARARNLPNQSDLRGKQ